MLSYHASKLVTCMLQRRGIAKGRAGAAHSGNSPPPHSCLRTSLSPPPANSAAQVQPAFGRRLQRLVMTLINCWTIYQVNVALTRTDVLADAAPLFRDHGEPDDAFVPVVEIARVPESICYVDAHGAR